MLEDDLLGFSNKQQRIPFVDIAMSQFHSYSSHKDPIISLEFEISNKGKRYVRSVYTFKACIATIGGLISSLITVGGILLSPIYKQSTTNIVACNCLEGQQNGLNTI